MSEESNIVGRLVADRLGKRGWRRPVDIDWSARWPNVWEVITTEIRQGHRVYEPGDLRVRGGDGEVVVSLTVGYLAQTTGAAGGTVAEALDRLEASLVAGTARWSLWKAKQPQIKADDEEKPDPQSNGRTGKRKKR